MSPKPTPPDTTIYRTPSVAYREGTKETIERVLEEIEYQAEKRVRDGFSEFNFTIGVLNCFFVLFIFNVLPQHFWVLYLVEAFFLFPAKFLFWINAKPFNQVYYGFDFCWIMNFVGVIGFCVLFLAKGLISDETRKQVFLAAFGIACGPLTGATVLLPFVSLIFHHRNTMTSFFIHFFPPLLFYVMYWESDIVKETWPTTFGLEYDIDFWPKNGSFTNCVFGNTFIAYIIWFVPYCVWQYYIGLDLPRSNRHTKTKDGSPASPVYDTVYHNTMRHFFCVAMGKTLWKRSKEKCMDQIKSNDYEMRDFVVYMIAHFTLAIISLVVLAYPCYLNKYVHGTCLWILFAICTYRGAKRYTYYSTKMYGRIIRKHFADEMVIEGST